MSRSKQPRFFESPRGDRSAPQIHLVQSRIFLLLILDVLPNHGFVTTDGRNKISSRSEVLPHEIALPLAVHPRQVNRTLALDVPDHLRYRIFRLDRDHHVHVIRHQMPFLDPALFLFRQTAKYFSKMSSQFPVQRSPAALRYEHYVIFAIPLRMA